MNEPRVVCLRCRRPERVCFCRHLVSIPSRTRVVFLQHPRERNMAIGTARMASLCLPGSELHTGVHWDGSAVIDRATSDLTRPAAVLWPDAGAIDIMTTPPPGPITLVVIDGTWSQAKKIVRSNPGLAALPRYAFVPPSPSEYRIRKEPRDDYVSTIEALVHVLGALEGLVTLPLETGLTGIPGVSVMRSKSVLGRCSRPWLNNIPTVGRRHTRWLPCRPSRRRGRWSRCERRSADCGWAEKPWHGRRLIRSECDIGYRFRLIHSSGNAIG